MEEKKKNPTLRWKIISGVLAVALITVSCLYAFGVGKPACTNATNAQSSVTETVAATDAAKTDDALSTVSRCLIWTERSAARPTPVTSTTSSSTTA